MFPWKNRFAPWLSIALALPLALSLAACSDDDDEEVTGPDTTRPRVVSVSPADGAVDTPIDTKLVVTFSEEIDVATMTVESVTLAGGGLVPAPDGKAAGARQLVFTPDDPLKYGEQYAATVDSALADLAGNTLAGDFEWSFTTASYPLEEIDFPLARDNTWLYEVVEYARAGNDTTRYEGLEVLWAEDEISYFGTDGWLIRRFLLDETATGASALDEDFCYLAIDAFGLYRAEPYGDNDGWHNLVVFGEEEFDDVDFLLAGSPLHADEATHRARYLNGAIGGYWGDEIDYQYVETGTIAERRREFHVNGYGLVQSMWQYANADEDFEISGRADLADDVNGPDTPWIEVEVEPNDGPSAVDAEYVELTTLVVADARISDGGTILTPEDIECDFFTCVNQDSEGVRILQDFYRLEITEPGQYRFDLIYDQFDDENDLDLYCFVELAGGGLRSLARADAAAGTPEYIVLLHADPGIYYLAVQAWSTPVPNVPVEYTLSLRPQAVEIPTGKAAGRGFLAPPGK